MTAPASLSARTIERMGALSGLGELSAISRRTGGQLSGVYEVTPARGGDPMIVKVYSPQRSWVQPKELHIYGLLEPVIGWATPAIVDAQTADNPTGHAYTVMTRVDGQPLSEVGLELDRAEMSSLYRQIGSLAAAIHSIAQGAFGYLTKNVVEPVPTNLQYMTRQFDRKLREFRDAGGEPGLARRIESHVAAAGDVLAECRHAVVCHNDLHEGNVLVGDVDGAWRVHGVIDVENAVAADPILDLAKTECYSIRGDIAKFDALADGYGPALRQSERRAELYRIYHTLELWDWFHETRQHQHLADLATQLAHLTP
ncbi:phosphotransferase family protein [Pseudonocardia xinjiangensis]|uniref:phosphotransferase family protein n=1 Tax=Pseudonocardia xinjiangensis TaxID=75289 RepID=UPI003D8D2141